MSKIKNIIKSVPTKYGNVSYIIIDETKFKSVKKDNLNLLNMNMFKREIYLKQEVYDILYANNLSSQERTAYVIAKTARACNWLSYSFLTLLFGFIVSLFFTTPYLNVYGGEFAAAYAWAGFIILGGIYYLVKKRLNSVYLKNVTEMRNNLTKDELAETIKRIKNILLYLNDHNNIVKNKGTVIQVHKETLNDLEMRLSNYK